MRLVIGCLVLPQFCSGSLNGISAIKENERLRREVRLLKEERDLLKKAAWFHKLKATRKPAVDHGVTYLDSVRHKLEVQHCRYRTYIKKLLSKFGPLAAAKFPGQSAETAARYRAGELKGSVDRPPDAQARQPAADAVG